MLVQTHATTLINVGEMDHHAAYPTASTKTKLLYVLFMKYVYHICEHKTRLFLQDQGRDDAQYPFLQFTNQYFCPESHPWECNIPKTSLLHLLIQN